VLAYVPPEMNLVEGQDLRLNCIVLMGVPRPTTGWRKDGLPLQPIGNRSIQVQKSIFG
jgi:hypothetical protein